MVEGAIGPSLGSMCEGGSQLGGDIEASGQTITGGAKWEG